MMNGKPESHLLERQRYQCWVDKAIYCLVLILFSTFSHASEKLCESLDEISVFEVSQTQLSESVYGITRKFREISMIVEFANNFPHETNYFNYAVFRDCLDSRKERVITRNADVLKLALLSSTSMFDSPIANNDKLIVQLYITKMLETEDPFILGYAIRATYTFRSEAFVKPLSKVVVSSDDEGTKLLAIMYMTFIDDGAVKNALIELRDTDISAKVESYIDEYLRDY